VEPFNSWAKILINTDHMNIRSDSTSFYFQFPWLNESDADAVVNCGTSLVVNGSADVSAAPGIFSGDKAYLTMRASLSLLRWSGWGATRLAIPSTRLMTQALRKAKRSRT
jgi:hypothetical protein